MNKLEERRESLERKILAIFHAVRDMPGTCEEGIGKYNIKRTLEYSDKTLRVSINTIKRIVDKMLDDAVIECVNPHVASGKRFRLRNEGRLYTCYFCGKPVCCFCHWLRGVESRIVKCCYGCFHNGDSKTQGIFLGRKELKEIAE